MKRLIMEQVFEGDEFLGWHLIVPALHQTDAGSVYSVYANPPKDMEGVRVGGFIPGFQKQFTFRHVEIEQLAEPAATLTDEEEHRIRMATDDRFTETQYAGYIFPTVAQIIAARCNLAGITKEEFDRILWYLGGDDYAGKRIWSAHNFIEHEGVDVQAEVTSLLTKLKEALERLRK